MKKQLTKTSKLLIVSCLALSLSGCQGREISKKDTGTLVGAVAGGLVGSTFGGGTGKLLTTAIGTGVGGYVGNKIGENMDKTDQLEKEVRSSSRAR